MKNIVKTIMVILIFVISVLLQVFVINKTSLFDVKPNMLLVSIILVSMFINIYSCSIYSFILGFVAYLVFGTSGIYTLSYSIIGALLGFVSDNYMKGNILSEILMTIGSVTVFEIIEYIHAIVIKKAIAGIFLLVGKIILGILLNVVIVIVLSFIIEKIIKLIDKKEDKIYW